MSKVGNVAQILNQHLGCENLWNDDKCMDINRLDYCKEAEINSTLPENGLVEHELLGSFDCKLNHTSREAPSEQYWEKHVLNMTSGLEDIGALKMDLVGYLALAYFILFICLAKGIQSSGKGHTLQYFDK
jgi:hypothetical protein